MVTDTKTFLDALKSYLTERVPITAIKQSKVEGPFLREYVVPQIYTFLERSYSAQAAKKALLSEGYDYRGTSET